MDKKILVMIVSIMLILTVATLRFVQINNNHLANELKLDECMSNGDTIMVTVAAYLNFRLFIVNKQKPAYPYWK